MTLGFCLLLALITAYLLIRPHYQFPQQSFDGISPAGREDEMVRSFELLAQLRLEEQLGKVSSAEAQRIAARSSDDQG
ncbi:MAG: hypothetical protein QY326_03465 [Bdellovibrionota bacterium]|nr:MAG: hypothetical protein QY326_03465 [Bdellovibrionota bacterium]